MNEVDRAVVLTKAGMLKITAAYLRILVDGAVDRPRTYEGLAMRIREVAKDHENLAIELEEQVFPDVKRN